MVKPPAARCARLRYLARVGAAVAILSLLVASAGVGLVLHMNLPAGRRVTARALSEFLSATFRGTLTIGEIERITTRGVTARDIVVHDVYGNKVLTADQLRGRADVFEILDDLLLSDAEKVTIVIRHARVENAEANIITDPTTGEPTIAGAFTLDSAPSKPDEPSAPGRQIRVWLPVIEIGRGYVRGRIANSPTWKPYHKVRGSVPPRPGRARSTSALRHGGAGRWRNRRGGHRRGAHPGARRGLGRLRRHHGSTAGQRVHPGRWQQAEHHRRHTACQGQRGARAPAGLAASTRRLRSSRGERRAAVRTAFASISSRPPERKKRPAAAFGALRSTSTPRRTSTCSRSAVAPRPRSTPQPILDLLTGGRIVVDSTVRPADRDRRHRGAAMDFTGARSRNRRSRPPCTRRNAANVDFTCARRRRSPRAWPPVHHPPAPRWRFDAVANGLTG